MEGRRQKVEGRMQTRVRLVLALVLAGLVGTVRAEVIDRVLAVVGSHVVTLSDVRAAQTFAIVPAGTTADSTADVLVSLVNRELMLGEVDRYSSPDPDRALLERRMAQIRARFPSPNQYQQALARTAMTDGRLRTVVADNVRIETYLDQRFGAAAQPTPDEVQRYYRDHPGEFTRGGQLVSFDEAQPQAQERTAAERRRALVSDWLDRLRRRGSVEIRGSAPVTGVR
jgi:hypothetical protein